MSQFGFTELGFNVGAGQQNLCFPGTCGICSLQHSCGICTSPCSFHISCGICTNTHSVVCGLCSAGPTCGPCSYQHSPCLCTYIQSHCACSIIQSQCGPVSPCGFVSPGGCGPGSIRQTVEIGAIGQEHLTQLREQLTAHLEELDEAEKALKERESGKGRSTRK
jgi:hypothetical protein